MEEAIKQIGERLKGLRDVLDIPAEEIAETCGITLDKRDGRNHRNLVGEV